MSFLELKDVIHLLRSEVERAGGQSVWAKKNGMNRSVINKVLNGRAPPTKSITRAFPEKTESRDSPAGTNRIQGSCWNGGQHGWRNRIRKICVRASLERD